VGPPSFEVGQISDCAIPIYSNKLVKERLVLDPVMYRFVVAVLASVAFRYPVWLFITNAGYLQKIQFWENDYALVCRWDCNFYVSLTENLLPSAFFPLFSIVSKFLMLVTGVSAALATLIASNLFTIVAGVLTLYLGELLWNKAQSTKVLGFRSMSWMLLAAVSFFPSGHFWVRSYPEALFYCLMVTGLIAVIKNRWFLSGISFGLTAVTRPQGVWIVGAFSVLVLISQLRSHWNSRFSLSIGRSHALVALIFALLPFALFMAWNYFETGNVIYFLEMQKQGWQREFSLMGGLKSHVPKFDTDHLCLYFSLIVSYMYIFRRSQKPWILIGSISFLMAELPLFMGGFYSYSRFMSTNLGVFCLLVEFGGKRAPLFWVWIVWSVARLADSTYSGAFGLWAG
jgi:hypothetical protein